MIIKATKRLCFSYYYIEGNMNLNDFFPSSLQKPQEPPSDLKEKILLAIHQEEIKRLRKKFFQRALGFSFLSIISFPYSWPVFLEDSKIKGFWFFLIAIKDLIAHSSLSFLGIFKEVLLAFIDFLPLSSLLMVSLNIFFFFGFFYFLFLMKNSHFLRFEKK